MPVAMTPMVGSPHSRAVLWATPSAPRAMPLTMHGWTGASARARTSFWHQRLPYGLRSRVPTKPIMGLRPKISVGEVQPLRYSPSGGAPHSRRADG